ncbi:uncharacterized protein LOC126278566 isoform X2 [Schistocerca gregaria]|uniref:uncharacterized protein LOC126278566 isoform X2 n=1 Tax=Schistocerca gregaria TaxID=7010 RepID=UPI00211E659C|nr:uncharacterized protein LOC126278566 isoform X2 [Schistocerca gregaria]
MRCFQNMYYTKQFAEWIRLTLLLCVALHCCLVKMEDISFEPRILLNKTCAFTSCRSARQESPNDMDLDTFLTARCYCDPDCKRFQDCCYDISNTSYYAYDQTSLHWSCSHIPSQAKHGKQVFFCWVPGYVEIWVNEEADKAVKEVNSEHNMIQRTIPCCLAFHC